MVKDPIIVPRFKKELGFTTTGNRSALMSKIHSKGTLAEKMFRLYLWSKGFRYRINDKKLPGSPDIVIRKSKVIVFIDGEFWHGYNWEEKKRKIKSNRGFWIPKIERNMQRDSENNKKLKQLGYKVFRFWEHQIKANIEGSANKVISFIDRTK